MMGIGGYRMEIEIEWKEMQEWEWGLMYKGMKMELEGETGMGIGIVYKRGEPIILFFAKVKMCLNDLFID